MAKCPPIISPECRGAKRSARPKGVDTKLCGTDTQALPPVPRAFGWRAVLRPKPPCVCWAPVLGPACLQPARLFVFLGFLFSFSLFSRISTSSISLCLPDAFLFAIKSCFDITEISRSSTSITCLLK